MSQNNDKIRRIVGNIIAAEDAGQIIPDQRVIARHPELASQLPDALEFLNKVRSAEMESLAAGSIDQPIKLCSDEELWAPIDCDEPTSDTDSNCDLRAGAIFGYELLERIGQGGQATVYRAKKLSTGGIVAIKVLPGGFFTTSRARARFEREAGALVRISHPNVVPVLDKGRTQDGSQFIVMEYVEGLPIDRFLKVSIDAVQTAGIFARIARALEELHRCGIVHRDLKPSNVLVDRYGQPKVLDFGLAQIENAPGITDTGQILGSLPWASPEQASGRLDEVSAQSDIYSFGVMLAYVLHGKHPYPTAGGLIETARHICETTPQVGTGKKKTPLEQIALKCLAKHSGHRYVTAGELAEELERIERGRPLALTALQPSTRLSPIFCVTAVCILIGTISLLGLAASISRNAITGTAKLDALDPVIELPSMVNSMGMRFVKIPAGRFMMGSPERQPGHSWDESQKPESIPTPFFLAETETTQSVYNRVMQLALPGGFAKGTLGIPIHNVTYSDAVQFCLKLSDLDGHHYRLPTEVEWEYACRAASDTRAISETKLSTMAWWEGNSGGKIHPVKGLAPNRWGLYDMLGGVAEMCSGSIPNDGQELKSSADFCVIRGGSYTTSASDCRASARSQTWKNASSPDIGFRAVLIP